MFTFRVVLVGEKGVGKTSIVANYTNEEEEDDPLISHDLSIYDWNWRTKNIECQDYPTAKLSFYVNFF